MRPCTRSSSRARGYLARVTQTEARWQKLASELLAHGVQSQYMARIQAHISLEERLEGLQAEHRQELAAALGKTDMRVNLALAELELCRARYDRATLQNARPAELARLAEAFNAQRAVAQARLRELLIQREAVGFRRNQVLDELYPIEPKLSLAD